MHFDLVKSWTVFLEDTERHSRSMYSPTKSLGGRFAPGSPFTRKKATAPKKKLTEEQRAEIQEAFDLFDTDKSGSIDYHELKVAMRALGFPVRKEEVRRLLADHAAAAEDEASVDYDTFLEISACEHGACAWACCTLRHEFSLLANCGWGFSDEEVPGSGPR